MTQYVKKLPAVFQTVTEKKFFDATLDQVFSKKDSDYLSGFIGRRESGSYNPLTDFYLPEPTKSRTWWQLEPTAFSRDADTTRTNIFFYEDLLEYIESYGGNTLNHDRLFNSEYYSFAPPIDYDMFINYQDYFWVEQRLPVITIFGVQSNDIIGMQSYTTPATATPPNFTLSTGMSIKLADDPLYAETHTVENLGGCDGLYLSPIFSDFTAGTSFEFLPWDGTLVLGDGRTIINTNWDIMSWDTQAQAQSGDYITIQRGDITRNAWSRTNKWFHIDTIKAVIAQTGTSFPSGASRALRPIVQFDANLHLYKSGTQFRSDVNYGFTDNLNGSPVNFYDIHGRTSADINLQYNIDISDGDLVVFLNDATVVNISSQPWNSFIWNSGTWATSFTSTTINQYIFRVSVDLSGNVTLAPHPDWASPIADGDIIFAIESVPTNGILKGETWYYNNGWHQTFNEKITINQPPIFQLFDHAGVPLDDESKYPESTFNGSKIFSYKVNTESGARVDPVLKFPVTYTTLGQASDIVFQNNLIVDRCTYSPADLDITGYYYYKSSQSPVLHNGWDLYTPCECAELIGPINCINTSKQRVIDKFTVGYGSGSKFKLSVTPFGYISSNSDIIVIVDGTEVGSSSIQSNGYTFDEINGEVYVNLSNYLATTLSTAGSRAVVVEIQSYTHGALTNEKLGYFQIPQQLEANPTQLEVDEITASDLIKHFTSVISAQDGLVGIAFGGTNNYRDTRKNKSVGSYILQNVTPLLKAMMVSSNSELQLINSIRFSQNEYTKFKNKYLSTALQLINQEFSPVQYENNTVVISNWVEEILRILNISKEYSDAFAYSYMIASGNPYASETTQVPLVGNLILTDYVDLTNSKNSMYIYDVSGVEKLLVVDRDYTIVSTNLSIEISFTANVAPGADIFVALYKDPLPAYIPATPSKLGLHQVYTPCVVIDSTYATPTYVIVGHDGSRTVLYGAYNPTTGEFTDYRDALLLELEIRIYNQIPQKYRNEYSPPLRIEDVRAVWMNQSRYSRDEYLAIAESYLNKWAAKNRVDYRINNWDSASSTTHASKLWKLYNYRTAKDQYGNPLNLPGNWKGIFQYMYGTHMPDTQPWAMLGFSDEPSWWESTYGAPLINSNGQRVWPSTATNMWRDIERGRIRQGPRAVYDPADPSGDALPIEKWARGWLQFYIPVDSAGELISIIDLFGIMYSGNPTEPFDGFDNNWVFGDGGPVEQAWLSSSSYRFAEQEILFLMRPAAYGELMWDTLGTEMSPGLISVLASATPVQSSMNYQYVQNDIHGGTTLTQWARPKNETQFVHAENVDGEVQVRHGYQQWISDNILFLGKDVSSVFGQKVRTLDVNLANKLAGFTNKDTALTYIESYSPESAAGGLGIPSNNFDVILHKSPIVETYSYSGVVIRALEDGTFVVYGYDLLSSEFTVLDRSTSKLIDVTVGGTPAEYQYFTSGTTYNNGEIVRHNGVYYVCTATHEAQKFEPNNWQKLKALPTVGGISVSYKPVSLDTTSTVAYGAVLKTPQEVFDFLIGWGAFLEKAGWKFDEVSPDTNIISDWLASAKQFLFWLNTSWAPDASIQLSPLANKATLTVSRGYPEDVETISNGVYSILDKNGIAIAPENTITDRDGQTIVVEPSSLAAGGIYYLQINTTETEHVLIFDNTTSFSDVIYSPLLRTRQQRIRLNGFRSNNWYGKMEAPGYLVIDNQLVPNFDTIVDSMRYYYDANTIIDNSGIEDLGRHLIGYESKSYLDNLQVSNDVQYLYYKGSIRQKGTIQAFDKLFRSTQIQSDESIEIYEEWALKVGDFGNTVEQVETEIVLTPEQDAGEAVIARLNYVPSVNGFISKIGILNAEHKYTTVPTIVIGAPDAGTADDRVARAYVVLDSSGKISRVDITDPGYGYIEVPTVTINSGSQPNYLDKLYAVRQGEIIHDTALDNIVDIDIDDNEHWIVRPNEPEYSLEFPTTNVVEYSVPNAGYVNFNDVDYASFDPTQTAVNWGTTDFNPAENDKVWIGKTFTESWSVYKLTNVAPEWFDVVEGADGNLYLRTSSSFLLGSQSSSAPNRTHFGNLIVLQTAEKTADASAVLYGNVVSDIVINDAGAGYEKRPGVSIIQGSNTSASALSYIADGSVSNISILSTGSGYISPTVTISEGSNTSASAIAVVIDGQVTEIIVTYPGAGYTSPTVTIAEGSNTSATATAVVVGGEITSVSITDPGANYTTPDVVIEAPTDYTPSSNYAVGFEFAEVVEDEVDPLITYNQYSLLTLDGTPITANEIGDYATLNRLMLFKTMRFTTLAQVGTANYISANEKIWVDGYDSTTETTSWKVYNYVSPTEQQVYREQQPLINASLFQSATVFDSKTKNKLAMLPTYDPFKNIFPAPAIQNISYITMRDPARYNVTPDDRLLSENIIFAESQVGQLWWDTSSVRYVYYEQPIATDEDATANLVYRRDNWGKIFPGSSIDIYEWVGSPVPPAQYAGTGTPRDITSYVQVSYSNKFTSETSTKYYFWVRNVTEKPNRLNRTLAALDVARILQSPKSQGFAFFAPIQYTENNNSYLFYNVQESLAYRGNHIQLSYRLGERNDQKHTQWALYREGDTASTISNQFWDKMVDSLCGYTDVLPESTEYSNSILIETAPGVFGEILPVPDPLLGEYEKTGVQYRPRQCMFVNLFNARKVFVQAANALLKYIPIRDDSPDWNADVSTDLYWTYTNWYKAGYEDIKPTIVFSTLADASTALSSGQLMVGDAAQVINGTPDGRFVIYAVVQLDASIPALSLEEVCIENSAIKLLDTVYTTVNAYNLPVELRELLAAFRTQVFIDENLVDQNKLFFSMLNFVFSEQKAPDWAFKTSYIYVKESDLPLAQTRFYLPNQSENVIKYIKDAKPYHTQVRDYTKTYSLSDIAVGSAADAYKMKITLAFGPTGEFLPYNPFGGGVDNGIGWDINSGLYVSHWDASFEITTDSYLDNTHWDNQYYIDNSQALPQPLYVINQLISGENNFDFSTISTALVEYTDPSEYSSVVGLSTLYPMKLEYSQLTINDPQTFIVPENIIAVKADNSYLIYGQDYYAKYNSDNTFTVYFFEDPSAYLTLDAIVWFNGGAIENVLFDASRNEVALGFPSDNLVVNVDTRFIANDVSSIPYINPGDPWPKSVAPYVGYGEVWDAVLDPVVSDILVDNGGLSNIPWDTPLVPVTLDNTISYKERLSTRFGHECYRNADFESGILVNDLLAPTVETENLDVIVVSAANDILIAPEEDQPGVIWIDGERIEYLSKTTVDANTWELGLIRRGTLGTAPVDHYALVSSVDDPSIYIPNVVWVEKNNILTPASIKTVWNALDSSPDVTTESAGVYTDVSLVPIGGLWYSNTDQAMFLKERQGRAIR